MSDGGEVERYVKDPSLLVELCREVIGRLDGGIDSDKTAAMEAQLREIARAIDKLDKQGVPVPDALRAEKTRLAAALGLQDERIEALTTLVEAFSNLLRETRNWLQQRLQPAESKIQSQRIMADRLSPTVIREAIINALHRLGGRATRQSVFDEMARQLEGHFLPGDLVFCQSKNSYSWQRAAETQRPNLIKEEILRSDSQVGIWELSEAHR